MDRERSKLSFSVVVFGYPHRQCSSHFAFLYVVSSSRNEIHYSKERPASFFEARAYIDVKEGSPSRCARDKRFFREKSQETKNRKEACNVIRCFMAFVPYEADAWYTYFRRGTPGLPSSAEEPIEQKENGERERSWWMSGTAPITPLLRAVSLNSWPGASGFPASRYWSARPGILVTVERRFDAKCGR